MKIQNPKVAYGEEVQVLNYRCKPPKWERGVCRAVAYEDNYGNNWNWKYTVFIDRGKKFFLYVGDNSIEKVEDFQ